MRPYLILFVIAAFFSGCNWINPSEETPSYVRIESFDFAASSGEGTSLQNITDAWIYIDGEKVGAFVLPCNVPLLHSGTSEIQVYPGIKLDGISGTRAIYPFMRPWSATVNLTPDSEIVLEPASSYYADLVFEVIEDFESGGIVFGETSYSDTNIYRTTEPAEIFEGGASGKIVIDSERPLMDIRSNSAFVLPKLGQYNFIELHFKTDVEVQVGLIANEGTQSIYNPVVVLNETSTWKKIYINLTPLVTREYDASSFYIFLRAYLPDDATQATVYLDNIKLIHAE